MATVIAEVGHPHGGEVEVMPRKRLDLDKLDQRIIDSRSLRERNATKRVCEQGSGKVGEQVAREQEISVNNSDLDTPDQRTNAKGACFT